MPLAFCMCFKHRAAVLSALAAWLCVTSPIRKLGTIPVLGSPLGSSQGPVHVLWVLPALEYCPLEWGPDLVTRLLQMEGGKS